MMTHGEVLDVIAAARREANALMAAAAVRVFKRMVRALARLAEPNPRSVLMSLSDRELTDIGISRGEIDHVVRYGRPEHAASNVNDRPGAAAAA